MTSKQLRGLALLANAEHNHGTAYSTDERQTLGLRGLLPPAICTMATHQERALANIRRKDCDIERYIFMRSLMGRNQNLFYRLLIDHVEELMPIVYTPTVGQACVNRVGSISRPRIAVKFARFSITGQNTMCV